MVEYADTSFLVSLYGQDTNSSVAHDLVRHFSKPLALPPLLRHEARNAIRLARFRGDITDEECRAVLHAIESDMTAGVLVEMSLPLSDVFMEAERLSAAHTARLGICAVDIVHVASARSLKARRFYIFELRQKALAVMAGLTVKP